jgi:hypothetical protein
MTLADLFSPEGTARRKLQNMHPHSLSWKQGYDSFWGQRDADFVRASPEERAAMILQDKLFEIEQWPKRTYGNLQETVDDTFAQVRPDMMPSLIARLFGGR